MILVSAISIVFLTVLSAFGSVEAASCTGIHSCDRNAEDECQPSSTTTSCGNCMDDPSLVLQSVTITQNGEDVDGAGGIDICQNFSVAITALNNHGAINNPKAGARISYCGHHRNPCKWITPWLIRFINRLIGGPVSLCDLDSKYQLDIECPLNQISVGQVHNFTFHLDFMKYKYVKAVLSRLSIPKNIQLRLGLHDGDEAIGCVQTTVHLRNTQC